MSDINKIPVEGHIVIFGWDEFARTLIQELLNAGRYVCLITDEQQHVSVLREIYIKNTVSIVYADFNNFDLIKNYNIKKSHMVVVNLKEDTDKLVYIINLKNYFGDIHIVVPINNPELKDTFYNAGVIYPLSKEEITGKMLGSFLFEQDVALYEQVLLGAARSSSGHDIKQYRITGNNPFLGSSCGEVFRKLREKYNAVLLGLSKQQDGARTLYKNPDGSLTIAENDYLIIIINEENGALLQKDFGVSAGIS